LLLLLLQYYSISARADGCCAYVLTGHCGRVSSRGPEIGVGLPLPLPPPPPTPPADGHEFSDGRRACEDNPTWPSTVSRRAAVTIAIPGCTPRRSATRWRFSTIILLCYYIIIVLLCFYLHHNNTVLFNSVFFLAARTATSIPVLRYLPFFFLFFNINIK